MYDIQYYLYPHKFDFPVFYTYTCGAVTCVKVNIMMSLFFLFALVIIIL